MRGRLSYRLKFQSVRDKFQNFRPHPLYRPPKGFAGGVLWRPERGFAGCFDEDMERGFLGGFCGGIGFGYQGDVSGRILGGVEGCFWDRFDGGGWVGLGGVLDRGRVRGYGFNVVKAGAEDMIRKGGFYGLVQV